MAIGTWVLVTDACRARVFLDHGLRAGLEELEGFVWPSSRTHAKNRVSDRSGQKGISGQGAHSVVTQEVDFKEAEARAFARSLAENLRRKHSDQAFTDLVLAAPPHFLGLLRNALDETVAKCVVATFDKDYTGLDGPELARRIMAPARV